MSATDLSAVAAEAEEQLRAVGTPERAVHEKAYLKSRLEHAGASLPAVRALAKRISRDHPGIGRAAGVRAGRDAVGGAGA